MTVNNQFNNRSDNISIMLISLTLLQAVKSYPSFGYNFVVTEHSSSMWLTDREFVQIHVTL